jgi:hypothetical protein
MAQSDELAMRGERYSLSHEWRSAIDKLQGIEQAGLGWKYTGKHDVKPLAALLASGKTVPAFVARILATHLDPPSGRWTGRLKYTPPPSSAVRFWKDRDLKQNIQDFYCQKMRVNGSLSAIKETAETLNVSEGTVRSVIGKDLENQAFEDARRRLDISTFKP